MHLPEIQGMILIADQIYRLESGKFIIAGTYSFYKTPKDVAHFASLQMYSRLVFEHFGQYACKLVVRDKGAPPTSKPLISLPVNIEVDAKSGLIIESAFYIGDLIIPGPGPADNRSPFGQKAVLMVSLVLGEDEVITSTDLDIIFVRPPPVTQSAQAP